MCLRERAYILIENHNNLSLFWNGSSYIHCDCFTLQENKKTWIGSFNYIPKNQLLMKIITDEDNHVFVYKRHTRNPNPSALLSRIPGIDSRGCISHNGYNRFFVLTSGLNLALQIVKLSKGLLGFIDP
ncbi:hypothetical protein L1887_13640 [Cichorium endivia]|nr:hypothetical protein L1887_13640 [Cichorium endivia]